jgi:pseudo-rSAM protein
MKKIYLFSSVFLWTTKESGLLYNVAQGSYLRFSLDNKYISRVCSQWQEIRNLYVARYDERCVDEEFICFTKAIDEKGLGKVAEENTPVVSIPPYLKIKHGISQNPAGGRALKSEPVLPCLAKVCFFLGGAKEHDELWPLYPKIIAAKLNVDRVKTFLTRCDKSYLKRIDLVISEWDYQHIISFAEGLKDQKEIIRFLFTHPDPGFDNEIVDCLVADGYAVTQVCPPDAKCQKVSWVPGRGYQLLARSEEEVEHWEILLEGSEGVNYDFKPIADSNLEFFRKYIFLSEEEILSQKLTKKDIFRHQALNVNQFGTFFVFPDGTIHPAADAPAIGTLEDSVHQTIIRELEENHAWRQTRRLMEPCKDCLYHDLCPSPSVYEKVFGVPGCTYWKQA